MRTKNKLSFQQIHTKPNGTGVFEVKRKGHKHYLGFINYLGMWEQYCFMATADAGLNADFALEIHEFLTEKNNELRTQKISKKQKQKLKELD